MWGIKDELWWPAVVCDKEKDKLKVQYLGIPPPSQVWLQKSSVEPYIGSKLDKNDHLVRIDINYKAWQKACINADKSLPLTFESRLSLINNSGLEDSTCSSQPSSDSKPLRRKRSTPSQEEEPIKPPKRKAGTATPLSKQNRTDSTEMTNKTKLDENHQPSNNSALVNDNAETNNQASKKQSNYLKLNLGVGISGFSCQKGKCMKYASTKKLILTHLNQKHDCLYCVECGELYNNIESLTLHSLTHKDS